MSTDFPGGKQMGTHWPKGKNPKAESFAATQKPDRTAAGMGSPTGSVPKSGAESKMKDSANTKGETSEMLQMNQPASQVGPAPTSRVFTNDYSKKGRAPGDRDELSSILGPLDI